MNLSLAAPTSTDGESSSMSKLKRTTAIWLSALLFTSVLVVAPAGASDPDVGIDSVEEVEEALEETLAEVPAIEELVEETLADVDDLEINENADVVVELEADDGSTVEIPDEADEPIVLENAEGEVLEVELPGNGDDAEVLDDGSVVYEDAVTDTDIVVQAQEDGGVRAFAVIDGAGAPNSFDFGVDVEGADDLILFDDGAVMVLDADGEPLAEVPAAWAYDAEGNEVPSWYSVSEGNLRLHVDHSATSAYPVVADPQFKRSWWGNTIKLNKREADTLIASLAVDASVNRIIAIICVATGGAGCIVWSLGSAIVAFGAVALGICKNSKGVDIHYRGSAIWCSGY